MEIIKWFVSGLISLIWLTVQIILLFACIAICFFIIIGPGMLFTYTHNLWSFLLYLPILAVVGQGLKSKI